MPVVTSDEHEQPMIDKFLDGLAGQIERIQPPDKAGLLLINPRLETAFMDWKRADENAFSSVIYYNFARGSAPTGVWQVFGIKVVVVDMLDDFILLTMREIDPS